MHPVWNDFFLIFFTVPSPPIYLVDECLFKEAACSVENIGTPELTLGIRSLDSRSLLGERAGVRGHRVLCGKVSTKQEAALEAGVIDHV
jgi:hypothetical protein